MRIISLLFLLTMLFGCSSQDSFHQYIVRSQIKPNETVKHKFHSREWDWPTNWLSYVDNTDYFMISYPANYPVEHPIFHKDMNIKRQKNKACTSSLTGSSSLEELMKSQSVWGFVELRPANDRYENPLCFAHTDGCEHSEIFNGTCKTTGATYAFCSENNGKTVVICLDQQTDNPTLAKEIFSSFRWIGAEEETEELLREVGLDGSVDSE